MLILFPYSIPLFCVGFKGGQKSGLLQISGVHCIQKVFVVNEVSLVIQQDTTKEGDKEREGEREGGREVTNFIQSTTNTKTKT